MRVRNMLIAVGMLLPIVAQASSFEDRVNEMRSKVFQQQAKPSERKISLDYTAEGSDLKATTKNTKRIEIDYEGIKGMEHKEKAKGIVIDYESI